MSKVFNMVSGGGGGGGVTASIFVTGLSQTDTVTATNGSKTLTGKWTQKMNPAYVALPDGYTQLEYIKATGSQFINTGIAPSSGISVELGMIPDTSAMSGNAIFGSTWDTSGFFLMFYQNNIRFHSKGAVVDISSFNTTSENKIVCTQSRISVNGTNYSLSGTGTDSSDNIVLWSVSNESDYSDNRGRDSKTYCRIKVGDSVVREYVPCKQNSDGAIGMYDLVSNAFFGNNGTGEFVAGSEVPQTIGGFLIKPIRDFGTWTVTATDGTKTATQDVLVDVITEYEIEMDYKLWLYRPGDECEDVTGGWIAQGLGHESAYNSPDAPTLTKNSSNMIMSRSKNLSYASGIIRPVNKINLSNYNSIHVVLDISGLKDASMAGCWIRESLGSYVNEGTRWYLFTKTNNGQSNIEVSYDISNLSGLYVPYFSLYHDGVVTFHKVWLE